MAIKCLVTGANGFIGSHLVDALLEKGYEVTCLVRKTSNLRWLQNLPVHLAYGDVTDKDALCKAVKGADYVYHIAGIIKALSPEEYMLVNAQGTANVLAACQAADQPFRRIVLLSSLAAVGPCLDEVPVREDEPYHPVSPYGRSKMEGELAALSYRDALPITIVRPPVVYGPRDDEILVYFRIVNRGILPLLGRDRLMSLIHGLDLAQGLILAAEASCALGRTYFITNDEPVTLNSFGRLIARSLGVKALSVPIPPWLIRTLALVPELTGRILGKPNALDRHKALELTIRRWVCDNTKAKQELGFQQRIPLETGIMETSRWYREQGWL